MSQTINTDMNYVLFKIMELFYHPARVDDDNFSDDFNEYNIENILFINMIKFIYDSLEQIDEMDRSSSLSNTDRNKKMALLGKGVHYYVEAIKTRYRSNEHCSIEDIVNEICTQISRGEGESLGPARENPEETSGETSDTEQKTTGETSPELKFSTYFRNLLAEENLVTNFGKISIFFNTRIVAKSKHIVTFNTLRRLIHAFLNLENDENSFQDILKIGDFDFRNWERMHDISSYFESFLLCPNLIKRESIGKEVTVTVQTSGSNNDCFINAISYQLTQEQIRNIQTYCEENNSEFENFSKARSSHANSVCPNYIRNTRMRFFMSSQIVLSFVNILPELPKQNDIVAFNELFKTGKLPGRLNEIGQTIGSIIGDDNGGQIEINYQTANVICDLTKKPLMIFRPTNSLTNPIVIEHYYFDKDQKFKHFILPRNTNVDTIHEFTKLILPLLNTDDALSVTEIGPNSAEESIDLALERLLYVINLILLCKTVIFLANLGAYHYESVERIKIKEDLSPTGSVAGPRTHYLSSDDDNEGKYAAAAIFLGVALMLESISILVCIAKGNITKSLPITIFIPTIIVLFTIIGLVYSLKKYIGKDCART
ncbi:MAG: hypothetical protein LBJ93_00840 [Clostridiales bacterium]|nr:hypothetical protein [Clostridiales bacterium]